MKVIATLILIFSISATTYAMEAGSESKAEIAEMGIVTGLQMGNMGTPEKVDVTRLHKFKTSVIKKALSFKTRRDTAKLA